jgi:hypothetical protein
MDDIAAVAPSNRKNGISMANAGVVQPISQNTDFKKNLM